MVAVAIGGAAILGAGASLAAGSSNSKAINKSTDANLQAQQQSMAAQSAALDKQLAAQKNALDENLSLQTGTYNSSGQLQTDIYNNNVGTLNPYVQTGYAAMNGRNALLGLPEQQGYTPTPVAFTPIASPTTPATPVASTPNPALNTASAIHIPAYAFGTPPWGHPGGQALVGENGPEVVNLPQGAHVQPNALGNFMHNRGGLGGNGSGTPATTPAATPTPATPALSPQEQAFQNFYQTPLYQFPLQQGLDAINSNYAARGALQSGAAMKAIEQYGSNVAGGALGDYLGYLGQQQGAGLSAATAQAGVGANYAGDISGLNASYANSLGSANSAYANNVSNAYGAYGNAQGQYATNVGNIYGNQATNNANNTNGMINGVGNALGSAAGYFAYSPYGGGSSYGTLSPYAQQNMLDNPGIF